MVFKIYWAMKACFVNKVKIFINISGRQSSELSSREGKESSRALPEWEKVTEACFV